MRLIKQEKSKLTPSEVFDDIIAALEVATAITPEIEAMLTDVEAITGNKVWINKTIELMKKADSTGKILIEFMKQLKAIWCDKELKGMFAPKAVTKTTLYRERIAVNQVGDGSGVPTDETTYREVYTESGS